MVAVLMFGNLGYDALRRIRGMSSFRFTFVVSNLIGSSLTALKDSTFVFLTNFGTYISLIVVIAVLNSVGFGGVGMFGVVISVSLGVSLVLCLSTIPSLGTVFGIAIVGVVISNLLCNDSNCLISTLTSMFVLGIRYDNLGMLILANGG